MRNFIIAVVSVLSVCILYGQAAQAACTGGPVVFVCNTDAPNPDPDGIQQNANNNNLQITVLEDAAIDTRLSSGGSGNQAIRTGSGNNQITVDGFVGSQSIAISTSGGEDTVILNNAEVRGSNNLINTQGATDTISITDSSLIQDFGNPNRGIESGSGDEIIDIVNSEIFTFDNVVLDTSSGNETINITDSTLRAGDPINRDAIETSSGNDKVSILRSIIEGEESIDLSVGDDTLTLGTGADMRGSINCSAGFDTLVFAMDVPLELLPIISNQIAALNPDSDSITINGLFYEWDQCDLIVNDLNGVQNIRPIPTLSEWGLIAMAGVLGIIGMITVRRRATA